METLGAPIGTRHTVPSDGFNQGEHGAGVGLSGGANAPNEYNSQAGAAYADPFNAGLGGKHASAGIPKSSDTPIADQFMSTPSSQFPDSTAGFGGGSGATGFDSTGAKLDNSLDNYSGATGTTVAGIGAESAAYGSSYDSSALAGDAGAGTVSGAYEGGAVQDALTGQSGARTTGAGVGYEGENLAGVGSGGAYGDDTAGSGTGLVGASGGAGGHYSADGAAGAGDSSDTTGGVSSSGKYGTVDDDPTRGQPLADPEEVDTGGRHGLVFNKETGTYEHRHILEGN